MVKAALAWVKNLGRNGWDPPIEVTNTRSVESRNVQLYKGGLGTKRGGSVSVTITGVTAPVLGIFEYIQTALASAELWLVDSSATTKILRCAGGSSFTNETLKDNYVSNPELTSTAVLNGKHYIAYKSGVNRLHVYDPNNASADTVRRTGLKAFAAGPTVANTGSGSYAATARYYRTRSIEQQSGVTTRRSEPSAATLFTPSGSGTAARVTRPTAVSENETHWEVEGSTDGITFYVVAGDAANAIASPIAIATTTYDDSSTVTTWGTTLTASAVSGTYTPFPSVKCLGTDGKHLYGFGNYELVAGDSVTPKSGRFYFTPPLDTTTTNDDERISNTTTIQGWIDVSRSAGTIDRGCSPKPVNNAIFCFQDRGVYALYPTESAITPYRRVVVNPQVGNLAQQAIVVGIDRNGKTACYFLDPVLGPYTVGGPDGLAWCGKDVADIWATVNRDATTCAASGEWFPDLSLILWLVAINGSNTPNFGIGLDPTKMAPDAQGDLRGGWVTWDGDFVSSVPIRCFSNTLNATRSSKRVPYTGGASKLLRYDPTVNRDDTTTVQAYVTGGAQVVGTEVTTLDVSYVIASAQSGVTLQQTLIRNTSDETPRTSTVPLDPVGSEATVLRKFGASGGSLDSALTDAWCFQPQIGDSAAANTAWQVNQWRARITQGAEF